MYDNSKDVSKWFADGGDTAMRYTYPLNPTSIVVDLGGFRGEFADKIYKKFGCTVHVFEPIKDYYTQCCKTNKDNNKVKVYPYGISGQISGPLKISIEGDASSIFKADTASQSSEIYVKPVRHLFDREFGLLLPHIDLLKINVEGAEFEILEILIMDKQINLIRNIQVQFHTFVPDAEARRAKLHEQLAVTHNKNWDYPFVWENWVLK